MDKKLVNDEMIVTKALNNNMVLVRDSDGIERICQGKGIGFQKRAGDRIRWSQVERSYIPENEQDRRHFQQLFTEIPDEYWEIAEKVVEYGRDHYKIKVSDRVILPLCDHMAGSVERYQKGTVLSNPMLWDIRRVYSDEFQIGKYALKLLEERYGVEMREDEAAFLAYHFVNAELGSMQGISPDSMTRLIVSVLDIVQESFQVTLNDEDWNYQRFVTHLKFFAARIAQRSGYQDEADDELYEELSERYRPVRNCVDRIADFILIGYHYDLSMDERLYLLIHIQRVTKRYMKKKKASPSENT
jgi:beta-glucoside operon transcriptional antiterminator